MRILFFVCMLVMEPVHDTIGIWADIGRTHCDKATYKEKLFPEVSHCKMPVGGIPVMKKRLEEQRCIPMK
jgi:hypothetical protein